MPPCLLGLSSGAVSDALEALAILLSKPLYLGKTTVFRNMQRAEHKARSLRRAWLEKGKRIRVVVADSLR